VNPGCPTLGTVAEDAVGDEKSCPSVMERISMNGGTCPQRRSVTCRRLTGHGAFGRDVLVLLLPLLAVLGALGRSRIPLSSSVVCSCSSIKRLMDAEVRLSSSAQLKQNDIGPFLKCVKTISAVCITEEKK
jgi:hypothetical protein